MHGLKNLTLFVSTLLLPFASASPVAKPRAADPIPNKYIITLKEDVAAADVESHLAWVGDVHARSLSRRQLPGVEKTYNISAFQGYAGAFDEATISEIEASPEVTFYGHHHHHHRDDDYQMGKIERREANMVAGGCRRARPDLVPQRPHHAE